MSIFNNRFLKSALSLALAVAMVMATTVTAIAYDELANDTGYTDSGDGNTATNGNNNESTVEEPPTQEPPLGSLVIINSTHEGHPLPGAIFGLYRVGEGVRLAELATDTQGRTQEIPLPQGNYVAVLLMPSHNHMGIVDRVYVTVGAGQRQVVTIFSMPIPPAT